MKKTKILCKNPTFPRLSSKKTKLLLLPDRSNGATLHTCGFAFLHFALFGGLLCGLQSLGELLAMQEIRFGGLVLHGLFQAADHRRLLGGDQRAHDRSYGGHNQTTRRRQGGNVVTRRGAALGRLWPRRSRGASQRGKVEVGVNGTTGIVVAQAVQKVHRLALFVCVNGNGI